SLPHGCRAMGGARVLPLTQAARRGRARSLRQPADFADGDGGVRHTNQSKSEPAQGLLPAIWLTTPVKLQPAVSRLGKAGYVPSFLAACPYHGAPIAVFQRLTAAALRHVRAMSHVKPRRVARRPDRA